MLRLISLKIASASPRSCLSLLHASNVIELDTFLSEGMSPSMEGRLSEVAAQVSRCSETIPPRARCLRFILVLFAIIYFARARDSTH